jgi:D-glycerate 3-kinase
MVSGPPNENLPVRPTVQDPCDSGDEIFAKAILSAQAIASRPTLVGLCGSQGSGKSTTAQRLVRRLHEHGKAVCVCCLDDFYLTKAERGVLAKCTHPLFATRGVPGTHDIALLSRTLDALLDFSGLVALPAFDKLADDRRPQTEWTVRDSPPDVVLLEGWCIGARPEPQERLTQPINELEAREDADGRWRTAVNRALEHTYADLFARLDLRLMLRAPSFECVDGWRMEQERQLTVAAARNGMSANELGRFVAHYERVTRWLMLDEPAELIADLDEFRRPWRWRLHRNWAMTDRAQSRR